MTQPLKLESLEQLGWRFGLDTIRALLAELGDPQLSLRVVHVAGSNGKGSTCAFMASFLKQAGYKTGLYTSPHLCDIRERFRINGTWISHADFNRHSFRVLGACGRVRKKRGHLPTHFEALTAIAFCWFKEQKVDWVVLEVGLGGRLDATNVIPSPALCLIAPIGLEHRNILGRTLGKIAWEKAGILKPGCPAATVQPHREAARRIDRTARERGVPLWLAGRDFHFKKAPKGFDWEGPGLKGRFKLPELPDYQMTNAALALAGVGQLRAGGIGAGKALIQKSFSKMRWPGRAETIPGKPLVLLDGAHNPEAAKALSSFLKSRYPRKRWIVVNGFLADKDYGACVDWLRPLAALSIVTEPKNGRKRNGEEVFAAWERGGVRALLVKEASKALSLALDKSRRAGMGLLVTGSLYLVGECRKWLAGLKGLETI